jgi:hypothetical protein
MIDGDEPSPAAAGEDTIVPEGQVEDSLPTSAASYR